MKVRSKARITSKGQITLPIAVRQRLGVHRGDEVEFEISDERIVVIPKHEAGRFDRYAGKFRIERGRTAAQTDALVRRLRGRE